MLNHNVEWQGTFQRCYDYAKLLTDRGHEVLIMTNAPKAMFRFESYHYDGIEIVRSPDLFFGILRTGWDPINVIRRIVYLQGRKFDLIHAFDNRPTVILPALFLSRQLRCPLISDWCDWWGRGGAIRLRKNKLLNMFFEPIETFFEEYFRKFARRLTVISEPIKSRAVGLGISPGQIDMIPPLVNTEKIYPMDKAKARQYLKLSGYQPILIFSSFVLYDVALIAQAYRIVHSRFPKSLLLLTGRMTPAVLKLFDGLPVHNAGFVPEDELVYYYGASDICLLPLSDNLTNRVRFPHKIGHYLAAGRPVLSNPVGEVSALIKAEKVGILTDSTPESFARGITELLNQPAELEEMGIAARETAVRQLSGSAYADKLEAIYRSCL